jgi:hypothetical protein
MTTKVEFSIQLDKDILKAIWTVYRGPSFALANFQLFDLQIIDVSSSIYLRST